MTSFREKLEGLIGTVLQFGNGGPKLKNNGGAFEARNAADAAFAITRGLDPAAANAYVTKGYFDANNAAANGLSYVKLPLALATVVSTGTLPNGYVVRDVVVDVQTAYDAGATFTAKRTGDAAKELFSSSDVDLSTAGPYHIPHVLDWGSTGAGTVTVTLAGTPTVGSAVIHIGYYLPTSIA